MSEQWKMKQAAYINIEVLGFQQALYRPGRTTEPNLENLSVFVSPHVFFPPSKRIYISRYKRYEENQL
jgi:hypothetical protein